MMPHLLEKNGRMSTLIPLYLQLDQILLNIMRYERSIILTLQFNMSLFGCEKTTKPKIELTHKNNIIRNSSRSREQMENKTPHKFRTAQAETSSETTFRYETTTDKKISQIEHTTNHKDNLINKRKMHLSIDTDVINQEHQAKQKRKQQRTLVQKPVLQCEDSTTILNRIQMKRKQGLSQSNIILDSGKPSLSASNSNSINRFKSNFQDLKVQAKKQNLVSINCKNKVESQEFVNDKISNLKLLVQKLKLQIQNDKVNQIFMLLSGLQKQISTRNKRKFTKNYQNMQSANQYSFRMHIDSDQKQRCDSQQASSIIINSRQYKKCKENLQKTIINQNKTVKNQNLEGYENTRRLSHRKGLKSKYPLTEIVNYVNNKK